MFEERMKKVAIPERVYSLCMAVKNKGIQESTLKELIAPSSLSTAGKYFFELRDAARQLGLITIKEKVISLAVDKTYIESMETMRMYIVANISAIKNGLFYNVSREYFSLNEEVFKYKSITEGKMIELLSKKLVTAVFEDDMLAWRFWASYLGFGHMHEMILLPNTYIYLKTVLSLDFVEKNKEYTFGEFLAAVRPYCDIVLGDIPSDKRLNMAFSNGLRALHDEGIIQLSHKLDRGDMWFLYESELHSVKSTVTHIVVRR